MRDITEEHGFAALSSRKMTISAMSIHCRILRFLHVIHRAIILGLQQPGREGQISYEAKEQGGMVHLKSVGVHDLGHREGCQDKATLFWEMKLGASFDLGTMSSWETSLSPGCCCFSSFRASPHPFSVLLRSLRHPNLGHFRMIY